MAGARKAPGEQTSTLHESKSVATDMSETTDMSEMRERRDRSRLNHLSENDFARSASGAAALEFALVALPFFALLFATLEIGLFYFYSNQLQMAAEIASRELLTGSLASGTTVQKFIDEKLCQNGGLLNGLLDCSKLRVEIGRPDNWSAADVSNNYAGLDDDRTALVNPAAAGRISILRIGYPLPEFAGLIGAENTGIVVHNGQRVRMIMGIAAFRVER